MGLFSKKQKNNDENTGILPFEQEDSFWDFSPINMQSQNHRSLTADEILGKTDNASAAENSVPQEKEQSKKTAAPSQLLFERMQNNAKAAVNEDSVPVYDDIKAEISPASKDELPDIPKSDISLTAELDGLIQQISNSNKKALSSVLGEEQEAEPVVEQTKQTVEPSNEQKEQAAEQDNSTKSFDSDIFKRFFMDENGKSAAVKKPLYSLDSVEQILAEAEKNADKNIDTLIADQKPEVPTESIDMQASTDQEFHYYADEDTANFRALADDAADTVYSPIEDNQTEIKSSKTQQKPKREKPIFNVAINEEQETSAAFEYNCLDDAPRIKADLKKRSGGIGLRLFLTLVVEIAAILFLFVIPQSLVSIGIINLAATLLFCIININMFAGFSGIFNKEKQIELPLAFANCAALMHAICGLLLEQESTPYLSVLLGLLQMFALIGNRNKYKRIFRNFRTISNNDSKYAIDLIGDQTAAHTMAGDSIEGEILLAAGRKTVNVNDFVKHSNSPQPHAKIIPTCAYLSLIAAVAVFGAVLYLVGDTMLAVTAFSLTLLLGCPLSVTLIGTLPLWLASKKLGYYQAMLAGHSSAEALSQVNAVAVDSYDIFPKGTVQLSGIKPLSPNKLDETILYAAVLCEAINNPLAPVFRKIANTSVELEIPHSDSIKYEYRMGLSGWVNDSQLLIGNRTLMEAHSVSIPPLETDRAILKNGYFPVYVARDGVACVLIAVSYKPNPEITYELRRLCNSGITLLINSNDPNITTEMICDYFGLYQECVKVMRSSGTLALKECTNYQESTSAYAAYTHSVCGLLGAVTAASKVKSLTVIMSVIHIIFAVLGITLTAVAAIVGNIDSFTTVYALLFQLLGVLCSYLPPHISRP